MSSETTTYSFDKTYDYAKAHIVAIIVIVLIIIFIWWLVVEENKDKDRRHRNRMRRLNDMQTDEETEPFGAVNSYGKSVSCANCGNKGRSSCGDCVNCGYCYTSDGYGTCVPGDAVGPYNRNDCLDYEYNTQVVADRVYNPFYNTGGRWDEGYWRDGRWHEGRWIGTHRVGAHNRAREQARERERERDRHRQRTNPHYRRHVIK